MKRGMVPVTFVELARRLDLPPGAEIVRTETAWHQDVLCVHVVGMGEELEHPADLVENLPAVPDSDPALMGAT